MLGSFGKLNYPITGVSQIEHSDKIADLCELSEKVEKQTNNTAEQRAKVFLIAGFLGSGKTTLVKRILGWQKNLSDTVILVNEFGEVGIDGTLLSGAGSEVVELASGCICCTLTADLLRCLSEITERFKPHRILIESSGVADPASVVSALTESRLASSMELEKIVTVLDADFWDVRENFGSLFFSQLKTANLIILNKIDLLDSDQLPIFLGEIHEEIVGSQVVPTIRCAIDPETLWAPTKPKAVDFHPLRFFTEFLIGNAEQPSNYVYHGDQHRSTSVASNNFVTFSFETFRKLDEESFKQFIDQLPWELFRMKGPVQFADRLVLVNFVGGKLEWSTWDGELNTRLAFIGWNVVPNAILEKIRGCMI